MTVPAAASPSPAQADRWTVSRWRPGSARAAMLPALATACRGLRGLAWLDSALVGDPHGRWSILALTPRWTLTAYGSRIERVEAGGVRVWHGDPVRALAEAVEAEQSDFSRAGDQPGEAGKHGPALPFRGGAIGYLGFELGRWIERLPATTLDDVGAPDLAIGWYDAALVWDHRLDEGWLAGRDTDILELESLLSSRGAPSTGEASAGGADGVERAEPAHPRTLSANLSRPAYIDAVQRARHYIERGDIYQVNLSQRFSVPVAEDGLTLYQRLRTISPAPFAAYLALGGVEVLSSSPERLLLADNELLETRPIKGTRARSSRPGEDARAAAELLASAKDRAEHVMIVDLERNDLGRVASIGSVHVPELMTLESFRHVHHLTSTVRASRRPEVGLDALLRAVFPGGSISGAPKIRALEIIDELEPTVRGVYTGAIGYISVDGRIDLNVAIRTLTLAGGVAHMQVGGAIVHDSVPEAEYQETLDKARGMARALDVRLPDEPAVGPPAGDTPGTAGGTDTAKAGRMPIAADAAG